MHALKRIVSNWRHSFALLILCIGTLAHADVLAPAPRHGVHLVSILAQHEQYRYNSYYATPDERRRGIVTCGFGRTIGVKHNDVCPIGTELGWLLAHVRETSDAVWALSGRSINCNQLAALTSLTYNVGLGAYTKSTLRKYVLSGDYERAAAEFPKWAKQGNTVLKGLLARRMSEQDLFMRPPLNC